MGGPNFGLEDLLEIGPGPSTVPKVKVAGGGGRVGWITSDNSFGILVHTSAGEMYLGYSTDGTLATGARVITIGAADPYTGNVGINTATPSEKLEVNGNVKVTGTVVSQTPGVNASLQRDVENEYLSISGGKTRRGATGGGLIQLLGNGFAGLGGSLQFILGQGMAAARHVFYNSADPPTEVASIDNSGKLTLQGPIGKIFGRDKVGIAANANDDVIFNYGDAAGGGKGHALWFHGGGGGGQGGGTKTMELTKEGDLVVTRNVTAANKINVWDSGWFQMQALGETDPWLSHNLGAVPRGIIVLCAASATPTEITVAGPSVAHWHDWAKVGEYPVADGKVTLTKGSDLGAFVRMTSSHIYVRAGDKVGWHSGGWQTSGWYKVIAWA